MVTRLTVDTFLSFRRVLHRFLSVEMFFYAVAKGRQIGIFSTWYVFEAAC